MERLHRTLKTATAITARKKQWLQTLSVVLMSIRATVNDGGLASFTAVTDGLLPHPRVLVDRQPPPNVRCDPVRELAERMGAVDFAALSAGSDHSGASRAYTPGGLQTRTHV